MRDRLIELLKNLPCTSKTHPKVVDRSKQIIMEILAEEIADYLLADGWIRPPCKVGDKVYKVWYTKCHNSEEYPDSYVCSGCYDVCDIRKEITEVVVPNLRFIVENFMSGYTNTVYYLTREEAEKALKGGVQG